MRLMNNSCEHDRGQDPLVEQLFIDGSLTLAERNRIHSFLNGTHCRNRPLQHRHLSDVFRALELINKTRRSALSSQLLGILSVLAEESGQRYAVLPGSDPSLRDKLLLRRRDHAERRAHDGLIVELYRNQSKSFPVIGAMFGRTAGHINRLYVRELALRKLEAELASHQSL